VGATVSYAITSRYGVDSFIMALIYASLVTGAVSMVLGLPALRVRGLLLGVVTLSFALAAQRWLLAQDWALGAGVSPDRPEIGPFSLAPTRLYYFWALGVLVVGLWLAGNVWRGGVGLRLRAVRDNEDGARAFGISATGVKLQGFAIAGLLAGMGGAVYGHLLSRIGAESFDVITSINLVALTVLGGIGLLAGPILGAIYIVGLPRFLPLDNAGLAASSLGWLLLILYFPGGIAQLVAIPRRRLIHFLARRRGIDVAAVEAGEKSDDAPAIGTHAVRLDAGTRAERGAPGRTLLEARGLVKHFGGVRAVDGVDLHLERGEILGLMGPNGAGKTTLFEILGGFTTPTAGAVTFAGTDVTHLNPEGRARLGLIRSFQDAALFQTLTVIETVSLAFERRHPTNVVFSTMGLQRAERAKQKRARELVALMGLDRFRHKQIRELSTGSRRICELACVVALEPVVLLLDEPSSGIAQRETEALGELLLRLRDHLGCTLVIIEHDIPLLMGLSTRLMAMDSGQVIAVGTPAEVRNDPMVVTSYLGTDNAAIERSGPPGVLVAATASTTTTGNRPNPRAGRREQ
jgi:ABC-type branched-subunit amino acid transport system ATPase component/ABC-type branched-subunit amino acid transport system permease subunit